MLHRNLSLFYLLFLFWHFNLFSLSVAELSLEEKVGQILMVHFHGQEANEEAKALIQELSIGGIIYYQWANQLSSPQQVQALSKGLQELAQKTSHAIPLFIAVDQEGGHVNRLKQGFTIFPGNYALGQTKNLNWGEESAWMIGRELKAVGVSLNLAPVVDVYTQSANPVIGIRAFSSDPALVADWGKCTIQGYKRAGIIAALKHFPGHGDVKVDSHAMLPILNKKRAELELVELHPFRILAPQADVIMTAHLLIPALDIENCVTFSKKIVEGVLRTDLNFQGVIMTDSLAMEGALSQSPSIEEAVVKSFDAGHDLILLGGKQLLTSQNGFEFQLSDVRRVHHFLVSAFKEGKLSEKRLDESVNRILALKEKYALFEFPFLDSTVLTHQVGIEPHHHLAQQIAKHAVRLVKGKDFLPLSFHSSSLLVVAPDCLRNDLDQIAWHSLGSKIHFYYYKGLNPDQTVIQEIQLAAQGAEKYMYFTHNAWQFSGQRELLQQLKKESSLCVAIAVRDPLDVDFLDVADVVLCTFSPTACSLQAAFDCLTQLKK